MTALAGAACGTENNMSPKLQAGGWSQSGKLTTGNSQLGVPLQADFSKSKHGAGNYTIQFGLQAPDPNTVIIRPEADIQWTVNGNTVRRIVSVTDGLSITGQAEYAKVRLYDAILAGNVPPAVAGVQYVASINIAPGVRASQQQPPTLMPQRYFNSVSTEIFILGSISVPATDFVRVPVPQNAGVISVFVTVAVPAGGLVTAADFQVRQSNPVVGALKRYFPVGEGWVSMGSGVTEINLFNFSAASLNASVVFGIDG
jgi:hypothetical protein